MSKTHTNAKPWREIKTRSWNDVKGELKSYLEADPRSKFEIIEKAGLSKDAYYKLFAPERSGSPMRRGTVEGLAKALNLTCMYPHGGMPSFGTEELLTQSLHTANTKETIQYAINIVGNIELLAEKTEIRASELSSYLEPDKQDKPISIQTLNKIAQAINRTLIVFGDNSISLVDEFGYDPNNQPTIVRVDLSTLAPVDRNYTPQIYDNGLFELIHHDIRKKHDITEQEIKVLAHIQNDLETNGTLSQWVNILYAIRGLNPI